MLDPDFVADARKLRIRFVSEGKPALCTHYLYNEEDDSIIKGFNEAGLTNTKEDKVKVICYPVYLDGNDNLLSLKYYDALQGCHLGIFPSYYEPWGYTPLESAALGVTALTTDLAGFGRFIQNKLNDKGGMYILKRFNRSEEEEVEDFAKILLEYSKLTHNERVQQKIKAKELAMHADWKVLVENYIKAHNLALQKER